jgi:hypothetical protein
MPLLLLMFFTLKVTRSKSHNLAERPQPNQNVYGLDHAHLSVERCILKEL